jgi:glutamate racemase
MPIVGTVPAIKPAAEATQSGLVSVLATEGTVKRDYTNALIRDFASACDVTLVSAANLASLAEDALHGLPVSDDAIRAEIASAFVARDGKRTDQIVLACTHYPLLLSRFQTLAPWPVTWIDPAPAIARRVVQLIGEAPADAPARIDGLAVLTGPDRWTETLLSAFAERGLKPGEPPLI